MEMELIILQTIFLHGFGLLLTFSHRMLVRIKANAKLGCEIARQGCYAVA